MSSLINAIHQSVKHDLVSQPSKLTAESRLFTSEVIVVTKNEVPVKAKPVAEVEIHPDSSKIADSVKKFTF